MRWGPSRADQRDAGRHCGASPNKNYEHAVRAASRRGACGTKAAVSTTTHECRKGHFVKFKFKCRRFVDCLMLSHSLLDPRQQKLTPYLDTSLT